MLIRLVAQEMSSSRGFSAEYSIFLFSRRPKLQHHRIYWIGDSYRVSCGGVGGGGSCISDSYVVRTGAPLLFPRDSLKKMQAPICFEKNILCFPTIGSIQLLAESPGHRPIPIIPGPICIWAEEDDQRKTWPVIEDNVKTLDLAQLTKIHLHLGHGWVQSMMSL